MAIQSVIRGKLAEIDMLCAENKRLEARKRIVENNISRHIMRHKASLELNNINLELVSNNTRLAELDTEKQNVELTAKEKRKLEKLHNIQAIGPKLIASGEALDLLIDQFCQTFHTLLEEVHVVNANRPDLYDVEGFSTAHWNRQVNERLAERGYGGVSRIGGSPPIISCEAEIRDALSRIEQEFLK